MDENTPEENKEITDLKVQLGLNIQRCEKAEAEVVRLKKVIVDMPIPIDTGGNHSQLVDSIHG